MKPCEADAIQILLSLDGTEKLPMAFEMFQRASVLKIKPLIEKQKAALMVHVRKSDALRALMATPKVVRDPIGEAELGMEYMTGLYKLAGQLHVDAAVNDLGRADEEASRIDGEIDAAWAELVASMLKLEQE